jgi:DNA-binding MarR family transcriptional regulator
MTTMTSQIEDGRAIVIETTLEPGSVIAPADPRLDTFGAFLRAHSLLVRRMDEELQAVHGLSLAEYDALFQLASAPGRRLRMSVLAERVLLSRSGITRLVDRLLAAGMVERSACVTDARGAEAALTNVGLERLRRASGTHLLDIERYFLAAMDEDERAVVGRVLGRIADGVGGPAGDEPSCVIPGDA